MEYSRSTAFLNLLPDSRLCEGRHAPVAVLIALRSTIMSGSLHPTEIHKRRHLKKKRNKLRAKIAAAPAAQRPAIEAKLKKTYALLPESQPAKAHVAGEDAAAAQVSTK